MKSGVRVPQCPQDKYRPFSLNVMTKHIDPCLSLMQLLKQKVKSDDMLVGKPRPEGREVREGL